MQKVTIDSYGTQTANAFKVEELMALNVSEHGLLLNNLEPAEDYDTLSQTMKDSLKKDGITNKMQYDVRYGTWTAWLNIRNPGSDVMDLEAPTVTDL